MSSCSSVVLYVVPHSFVALSFGKYFPKPFIIYQGQCQGQYQYFSEGHASFHETNHGITLLRSVKSVHGRPGPVNRRSCLVH